MLKIQEDVANALASVGDRLTVVASALADARSKELASEVRKCRETLREQSMEIQQWIVSEYVTSEVAVEQETPESS